MFTEKTVLFLGAGASKEYGYPLGGELGQQILNILKNENTRNQYKEIGFDDKIIAEFINQLEFGQYWSVDELLGRESDLTELGKVAICKRISDCEGPNIFRQDLWYSKLITFMDSKKGNLIKNKLSIVTLNYDRSLEAFLHKVIPLRAKDGGAEFLKQLNIIHLHGRLSFLPVENKQNSRPYPGKFEINKDILEVSKGINVLHEADSQNDSYNRASKIIAEAEKVYFLGFGYHSAILEALNLDWSGAKEKYYGLTTKLSDDLQPKHLPINRYNRGYDIGHFMECLFGRLQPNFEK